MRISPRLGSGKPGFPRLALLSGVVGWAAQIGVFRAIPPGWLAG
jgi:hypothetical protein